MAPMSGVAQPARVEAPARCSCGRAVSRAGEECTACRERRRRLQRRALGRRSDTPKVPAGVHAVLAAPGQPLDAGLAAELSPRFGCDFSRVRVHADAQAAASADALDAAAYTVGRDVVFGAGRYAPASAAGRELITHELVHVAQQARGPRSPGGAIVVGGRDDPAERQAVELAAGPASADRAATLRRSPAGKASRAPAAPRRPQASPIVDDGAHAGAGQMRKSEFLDRLEAALVAGCDAELVPFGRTARGCPYIVKSIERYRGRPAASLLRLIRTWAHPPEGAGPQALIEATTQRARRAARRVGQQAGDRGPLLQAMTERPGGPVAARDAGAVRAKLGEGRPLGEPTRTDMEGAFGRSFASVRVHSDSTAARLSAELGAAAFAVGDDIAFAAGRYRPGTATGDRLIAHELAHTVQQASGATAAAGGADDARLEHAADRAAAAAVARSGAASAPLRAGEIGPRVQRWPAVVAGALVVAEAAPEAIVVAEIATTEVVVADGALVVAAELTPTLVEVAAPTVLETLAPAALETVAPAAAASSSSLLATTLGVGVAATTLSSDSPTEQDQRRRCQETHPGALPCTEGLGMEEVVQDFLMNEGYGFDALGDCNGIASFGSGAIDACGGAPGERWHCSVSGASGPVSIFGCLCCNVDGTTGYEWLAPHWSVNLSTRGGRR